MPLLKPKRDLFLKFLTELKVVSGEEYDLQAGLDRVIATGKYKGLNAVTFLREVLDELEDTKWSLPSHKVRDFIHILPRRFKDQLSDDIVLGRLPETDWRTFRSEEWVAQHRAVRGARERQRLEMSNLVVDSVETGPGFEKYTLLVECAPYSYMERYLEVKYPSGSATPEIVEKEMTAMFGPEAIEPDIVNQLSLWISSEGIFSSITVKVHTWPKKIGDLLQPTFVVHATFHYEMKRVNLQTLSNRLAETFNRLP